MLWRSRVRSVKRLKRVACEEVARLRLLGGLGVFSRISETSSKSYAPCTQQVLSQGRFARRVTHLFREGQAPKQTPRSKWVS